MLAVRREADRMQLAAGQGRFRRRSAIEDTSSGRTLVLFAVYAARDGDEDALRFLYLRYADNIYSYVCSLVKDEHDAEDVTQAIFARLPERLAKYRPQVVPFTSWIMRVAHNAAIDHVRSRRQIPCEEVRDPHAGEEDLSVERLEALRIGLAGMPPDQREVFVLRFVSGMTPGEIAQRMNRSENAIHALQHRGRRRLQAELTQLGVTPMAAAA
jgi:RNA polymerase sigma-70 factor (ECF subfamily)